MMSVGGRVAGPPGPKIGGAGKTGDELQGETKQRGVGDTSALY